LTVDCILEENSKNLLTALMSRVKSRMYGVLGEAIA
jgi:hypothetical protein